MWNHQQIHINCIEKQCVTVIYNKLCLQFLFKSKRINSPMNFYATHFNSLSGNVRYRFIHINFNLWHYFHSLSTLHDSFGSPSSPRDVQNILSSCPAASSGLDASQSTSQPCPTDSGIPGFATSMKDWTPEQKTRPKSAETNRSRTEELNTRQPGKLTWWYYYITWIYVRRRLLITVNKYMPFEWNNSSLDKTTNVQKDLLSSPQ